MSKIIANYFKYNNIVFDNSFTDGQFKKTADNSKLKEYIGDFEFTNIEE